MSEMATPGQTAQVENPDSENKDIIITSVHETRQDEFRVKWNYNKDPVHVYDYEENQVYPPGARVIGVVYVEDVKSRWESSWMRMDAEELQEQIETGPLTEYHFPEPRLHPVT